MKIVYLLDWFLYYTVELANALSERNEVMLITRDHNFEVSSAEEPVSIDEFLNDALIPDIKRNKLRFKRRDIRNFAEISRIRKVITAFDPDVIHIQDTVDWRILTLAAYFRGKKRIVVTVHDVESHPGETRGAQIYFWKKLIGNADLLIVHGKYLRDRFLSRYPDIAAAREIAVIPHGAYSIYKKWDSHGIPEEKNSILFFGRISKYKGIEILIEALKMIRQDIPNVRVILAGHGDDFGKYERLIGNDKSFEIHNRFIRNSEVSRFFRRSSLVVLPYIEASQSGVAAIAFAFGKPLVVTDVGSIPEVVDNGVNGFVVPPNDPTALANAIVRLLKDNELRAKMAARSLSKGEGELSWKYVSRQLEDLYRSLNR